MDHFTVRPGIEGGELWCEGVRLADIADAVGTPAYVYSTATIERHYQRSEEHTSELQSH